MLFVRPDKLIVVDRLRAAQGKRLPEVQWLLQLPNKPRQDAEGLIATNGKSWLRCRGVLPGEAVPEVSVTPMGTHRLSFNYTGKADVALLHALEVGDGPTAGPALRIEANQAGRDIEITVEGQSFLFEAEAPYPVVRRNVTTGR